MPAVFNCGGRGGFGVTAPFFGEEDKFHAGTYKEIHKVLGKMSAGMLGLSSDHVQVREDLKNDRRNY